MQQQEKDKGIKTFYIYHIIWKNFHLLISKICYQTAQKWSMRPINVLMIVALFVLLFPWRPDRNTLWGPCLHPSREETDGGRTQPSAKHRPRLFIFLSSQSHPCRHGGSRRMWPHPHRSSVTVHPWPRKIGVYGCIQGWGEGGVGRGGQHDDSAVSICADVHMRLIHTIIVNLKNWTTTLNFNKLATTSHRVYVIKMI